MTSPLTGLPGALYAPGRVPLTSDNALARRVNAIASGEDFTFQAIPVRELSPSTTSLRPITPIDLLDALGRATSSMPGLATAGAAGMVGLSAMTAASQWATLKYLWAFRRPFPNIAFSALTDEVRAHQRSVFSEQFGIAVATCVVERMLNSGPGGVRIVDADALAFDATLSPLLGALAQHRPDYFMYTSGPTPDLFVVEVKGTSSSKSMVLRQLARGLEQVGTIGAVQGFNVRRIVIGAQIGTDLRAFALELPFASNEEQEWEARRLLLAKKRSDVKPLASSGAEPSAAEKAEVGDEEVAFELPREDVSRVLGDAEARRLRVMAGVASTSVDAARAFEDLSRKPTRTEQGRSFVGTDTRIDLAADTSIRVFQGVERSILEAAMDSPGDVSLRVDEFSNARDASLEVRGGRLIRQTGNAFAYEGADGHLLEVVVTL